MSVSVTHIVRQYLPSIGGMEEVVRNIASHQQRSGIQSTRIITLDRLFRNTEVHLPSEEEIGGVKITRLPYFGSTRYPVCLSILRHIGRKDVIHVHGVDFFYDFMALTKGLHRRPLLLSTHGGFFHTEFASKAKQLYFNTMTRLNSKAYDSIVATSRNDGQLFQQITSSPKLQVIENGVDVDKFADQAASELQPTLIYFGRWSSNKGLMESLTLLANLCAKDSRWRLIIAGREYDYTEAELRQKIQQLGLDQQVTLKSSPTDAELRALIGQASYFLCLSRHEGFGIAPIEGMSAGLTPILSDIPPFRQLAEQSHIGFVSSDPTGSACIDRLMALQSEGNTAYQQRRSDAQKFSRRYAWPAIAERYMKIYDQLGASK